MQLKDYSPSILIKYLLVLLAVCLLLSAYHSKRKVFWDSVPYMGSVLSFQNKNTNNIHTLTYRHLKKECNQSDFELLTRGHSFVIENYQNKEAFLQQLPFFKIKWLYVFSSYVFYLSGFSLYSAIYLPVLAGAAGIFFILFNYFKTKTKFWPALLLSAFICLLPFNFHTFQIPSPDSTGGFFFLLSIVCILKNPHNLFSFIFLSLSAFFRPDLALFVPVYLIFLRKYADLSQNTFRLILSSFTVFLLMYLYLSFNYDSWKMFYRSFNELTIFPDQQTPEFTLDLYLSGIKNGIINAFLQKSFWLLIILNLLLIIGYKKLLSSEKSVLKIISIGLIIRTSLHPWFEDRFLFSYLIIFILLLSNILFRLLNEFNSRNSLTGKSVN